MQPTRYKIQINNPCSEDWDKMKSHPTGKFCDSCQKNVVDFTNKSEQEITEYIKAHEGEKMCGRFYNHQVETIRIEFDRNILFTEIPFWQKFLVIVLVCFGSDLCGQHFAFSQTDTLVDTIPLVQQYSDSLDTTKTVSVEQDLDTLINWIPNFEPGFVTGSVIQTCELVTSITFGDFYIEPEHPLIAESPLIPKDVFAEYTPEVIPDKHSDSTARENLETTKSSNKKKLPKKEKEEPLIAILPEPTAEHRSKRKES